MNVLGIDLGGTNLRAGLVNDGRVVGLATASIRSLDTKDDVLGQVHEMIQRFQTSELDGIGIGVPGLVDIAEGIVFDVVNIPSWKEVPLGSLLEQRYSIPVCVNNDANCFAAGEKFFGKGKEFRDFVALTLGTGLGAGLVINDRLYTGRNCGAGEFGMVPWKDGVLEHYASGQFFKKRWNKSGEELFREACEGCTEATVAFEEFGRNVGAAINLILLAVDPELIILGGSVSKSFPYFRDTMWSSLSSFPYLRSLQRLRIEVSELENAAVLGAAALLYEARGTGPASTDEEWGHFH